MPWMRRICSSTCMISFTAGCVRVSGSPQEEQEVSTRSPRSPPMKVNSVFFMMSEEVVACVEPLLVLFA